jgi:D-alanyl-D-alanine carboxypeptidase (penicillin-binding protein 5/6)
MSIINKQFVSKIIVLLLASLGTLFSQTTFAAASIGAPPPPDINARGYLLMDYNSGDIITSEKADERMEPASLTKMMTSYVILNEMKAGKIGLKDEVLISEKAWRMEGSRTFVEVGKRVPVDTLLKGMIVQSGNDATVALAEYVGGSEDVFASLMNQTAKALGMNNSHFVNSTGLPDPDHYSTAHDLAILARALIRDFPEHYDWYSIREFSYNGITQYNRNKLLWQNENVDGVKTGHTESAGYCLVASAKEDDMRLISVVMGTDSENARARESQKLLSYGFRFFETHRLYAPLEPLTQVKVWKGESEKLALGLAKEMYVTIPRGQYDRLNAAMKVATPLSAPIEKGKQYGTVEVTLNGAPVASQPLIALQAIPEGGFFSRLVDEVMMMFE